MATNFPRYGGLQYPANIDPQVTPREPDTPVGEGFKPKPPPRLIDAMLGPAPPGADGPYAGPSLFGIGERVKANMIDPAVKLAADRIAGLKLPDAATSAVGKGALGLVAGSVGAGREASAYDGAAKVINTLAYPISKIEELITGKPTTPLTGGTIKSAMAADGYAPAPPARDAVSGFEAARPNPGAATAPGGVSGRITAIDGRPVAREPVGSPALQAPAPVRGGGLPTAPVQASFAPAPVGETGLPTLPSAGIPSVSYRTQVVRNVDPETGEVSFDQVQVPVDNSVESARLNMSLADLVMKRQRLANDLETAQFNRQKGLMDLTLGMSAEQRARQDQYHQNLTNTAQGLGLALAEKDYSTNGSYSRANAKGEPDMEAYTREALTVLTQNGYALRAGGMGNLFDTGELSPDQLGRLTTAVRPSREVGLPFFKERLPPTLALPVGADPSAPIYIHNVPLDPAALAAMGYTPEDVADMRPDSNEFRNIRGRAVAGGLQAPRLVDAAMR